MNVLLLTNHLNIGGVTSYVLNLAHSLRKKGAGVYIASRGGALENQLKRENIQHFKIKINTKFEFHPVLIPEIFKLVTFVNSTHIDIIHAQTRVTQVIGYIVSKLCKKGYVTTCHGFFKSRRLGRRLFSGWGRYVIAVSEAVKKHLLSDFGLDRDRVFLIPNGINFEKFKNTIHDREKALIKKNLGFNNRPVVGTVSRLVPVKGIRYLFFAMKDVSKDIDASLLVVGEGPEREELILLADRLGLRKRVFFALSLMDTYKMLSVMDVFVFYSMQEGLGLSLMEAMGYGIPCIATDVGGIPSLVKNHKTGILVPPGDSCALADAIRRLINDREFARELAGRGAEFVKKNFSLDKMTDEVLNVYEKSVKQ